MSAVEFFDVKLIESCDYIPKVEIFAKVIPTPKGVSIKSIDNDGLRGAIADAVYKFVKTEELRPCGVTTSEKQ